MGPTVTTSAPFRFDAGPHEYLNPETGEVYPHITGMLEATGWIDDTWFTEESCDRGTAVHKLTADYDLGVVDLDSYDGKWRGYLLAHATAMRILQPTILAVEEPLVHPTYHFGGRPDRRVVIRGAHGILEIKSGAPAPRRKGLSGHVASSHELQTALQCLLVANVGGLPMPSAFVRLCLYVREDGKFKVEEHKDRRDFDEAHRIIRECRGMGR